MSRGAIATGLAVLLMMALILAVTAGAQDRFVQATAHEMAADHEAALQVYESFLRENPGDRLAPLAAMAAANIHYLAREDLEAAERAFDRVIRDYSGSEWAPEAARRKGECLQAREQWAGAGEAYGQALELSGKGERDASPDWINEVSLAAADCYYELGDRSQVIATYERALTGSLPPHAEAAVLYRLGDCYEQAEQPEAAAQQYARIVVSHPYAPAFEQAMTRRELIAAHVEMDWAPYETYLATSGGFQSRDFAGVVARCDTVLATSENRALRSCAQYRRILAETVVSGDFTTGALQLERFLADLEDPRTMPNAQQQLDQIRMVAGLEAQAVAMPDDAGVLRNLGMIYLRSGALEKSITTLERARDLDPEEISTYQGLGYAYATAQRSEEARAAFARYLEENPEDVNALNMIGYTYLNLGNAEEGIRYFRRYVEAAPEEANAHDSLGEGLLTAGRLEEAAREYERAIELDPDFFNSYFMLGQIYRQLEQSDRARAAYQRFLELAPAEARAEAARTAISELSEG